jgi:hypothetical protein
MCKTIPTFYLHGLDAIPADVIVEGDTVRVTERGTSRALHGVKQGSRNCMLAGWPPLLPSLVRRELAPADSHRPWELISRMHKCVSAGAPGLFWRNPAPTDLRVSAFRFGSPAQAAWIGDGDSDGYVSGSWPID